MHSSSRGPFERDRARILHSSSLRRLGTKTQVLRAGHDDFVRTRLTHSLEVAQVGRDLATALGANPDVVDAACLAHDIGHPPFGHHGEALLNEIAKPIGGFEGNAQTFRILTRLEPKIFNGDGRSVGLNLTRATLDAVVKYPWSACEASANPTGDRNSKWGAYDDDLPYFNWVRRSAPQNEQGERSHRKCFEAEIMDIADDISYSVHDIEDALVLGIFPLSSLQLMQDDGNLQLVVEIIKQWYGESNQADDIFEARENLQQTGIFDVQFTGSRQSYAKLKNMTSTLIGQFARSITEATRAAYGSDNLVRYQASVVVPRQTRAQINLLKGISAAFVMAPREELSFFEEEKHIIEDLVNYYMHGDGLDEIFRQDYEEAASDSERLRVVIDQIACLTDNSAKQTASSLLGVL